ERDVVVARDDEGGRGHAVEERPRGAELAGAGPLGEVAAHRDQRRALRGQVEDDALHDRGIFLAEVQVREMRDGFHAAGAASAPAGAATITGSAPGRIRQRSGESISQTSPSKAMWILRRRSS